MSNTNRDPYPQWWYTTQYDAAAKLFEEGHHVKSLAAAKYNLSDITLPPYHVIKNRILVAGALDNWEEAEIWMHTAEQAYTTAFRQATAREDERSLEALEDLRDELDHLEGFREDFAATTGVEIYDGDEDVEDMHP